MLRHELYSMIHVPRLKHANAAELLLGFLLGQRQSFLVRSAGLSRPRPESHQQLYEFCVADIKARYQLWKSCGSLKTRTITIWGKFDPCAEVMAQCGGRSKSTAVRDIFY